MGASTTSKTFRGSVAIPEGGVVKAHTVHMLGEWARSRSHSRRLVHILFISGECCQEFRFLRCDLRTPIENYGERSEGTQRARRITDEFDPRPQFFCGVEGRNGPVR